MLHGQVDPDVFATVKSISNELDWSMSMFMRVAIDQFLKSAELREMRAEARNS